MSHVPVLGGLAELPALVEAHGVGRVIFAFTNDDHRTLPPLVRHLRDSGVQVDVVPRLFEVIGPKVDIHTIEGVSVVGLPPVKLTRSSRVLKRALDLCGRRSC